MKSRRSTRRKMRGGDNENYDNLGNENEDLGNNNSGNNNSGNNNSGNNNSGNYNNSNNDSSMNGGMRKLPAVGSKAQVWHGTAKHTSGGLTRKDLMKTKKGRIVSKAKHALGKKALKNLVKAGYKAKKGTFKIFRK